MSLYIDKQNRSIYRSKAMPSGNNQQIYFSNHTGQMVKEQLKMNQHLLQSHEELKKQYMREKDQQRVQWQLIQNQLHKLQEKTEYQENQRERILKQLKDLETLNIKVEDNQLSMDKVENELQRLADFQQTITKKLETYNEKNDELLQNIHQSHEISQKAVEKMNIQEEKQQQMEKRLDNQEALTEKIIRQLEHIRSILFERTDYLAGKIDTFAQYFNQFFPNNLFMMPKGKTKEEKSKLS